MNKRERTLLIVTVVVLVIGGVLYFMPENLLQTLRGGGGDLASAQKTFQNHLKTLKQGREIRAKYKRIEVGQSKPKPGQTPSEQFSNELYQLLTERFRIAGPNIEKARRETIEDVDDYYFVEIPIQVNGTRRDMVQLLINLEDIGVLIKTYELGKVSGRRGGNQVSLDVEVARLVKHDEESRELFRRFGKR